MKLAFSIVVLWLFFAQNCRLEDAKKFVTITLFYETHCPHCVQFVTKQLYELTKNQNILNHVKLDLVPFGNAKMEQIDGKWNFTCQHGEPECNGNKMHACALQQTQAKDNKKLLELLNCFMPLDYEDEEVEGCCKDFEFDYSKLKTCMETEADDLLAQYGNRTLGTANYVPFILINNYQNQTLKQWARTRLVKTVCFILDSSAPTECDDI